ncbi:MAG: hypothetical protein Q8L85_05315 [Alphaproteobacteria bacterium]|nr:hypothetical protein [Alphaproteobacteria bacterium]
MKKYLLLNVCAFFLSSSVAFPAGNGSGIETNEEIIKKSRKRSLEEPSNEEHDTKRMRHNYSDIEWRLYIAKNANDRILSLSAAELLWSNQETRKFGLQAYIHIARHSENVEARFAASKFLFNNQKHWNNPEHWSFLEAPTFGLQMHLSSNAEDVETRLEAAKNLWNDRENKVFGLLAYNYIARTIENVDIITEKNISVPLEAIDILWKNKATKKLAREAYLQVAQNAEDYSLRLYAASTLFNDEVNDTEYYDAAVQALVEVAKNEECGEDGLKAAEFLWQDSRTKHKFGLSALLHVIGMSKDEEICLDGLDALNDETIEKKIIIQVCLDFAKKAIQTETHQKLAEILLDLDVLIDDPLVEKQLSVQVLLYIAQHLKCAETRLETVTNLWEDQECQHEYRQILIDILVGIAKNNKNDMYDYEAQFNACAFLCNDLDYRRENFQSIAELVNIVLDNTNYYKDSLDLMMDILWDNSEYRIQFPELLIDNFIKITQHPEALEYFMKHCYNFSAEAIDAIIFLWNNSSCDQIQSNTTLKNILLNTLIRILLLAKKESSLQVDRVLLNDPLTEKIAINAIYFIATTTKYDFFQLNAINFLLQKRKYRSQYRENLIDTILHFPEVECHACCTLISKIFLEDLNNLEISRSNLLDNYKRLTSEHPNHFILNMMSYSFFGDSFKEEYNSIMLNVWRELKKRDKSTILSALVQTLGESNSLIQELLLLYAQEDDNNSNNCAIAYYAKMIQELNKPFMHNPALFEVCLTPESVEEVKTEPVRTLYYKVNHNLFNYMPIAQERIADIEDVEILLENCTDEGVIGTSRRDDFIKYFAEPFSQEALKLQAMVKKFRSMGEAGKKSICNLLKELHSCRQGMNEAIWINYEVESKPLFSATLNNVTNWYARLLTLNLITDKYLLERYKKDKTELSSLILTMISSDHVFGKHLRGNNNDSILLKGLLGSIVQDEEKIIENNPNDAKILAPMLIRAMDIITMLSDADNFSENLHRFCEINEIALPADIYVNISAEMIENLVNLLEPRDVEGRGDFDSIKTQLHDFVVSNDFTQILKDLTSETGDKLRELIKGFISNKWVVGLLNLMMLSEGGNLLEAVDTTYANTRIDKDISLSWKSLTGESTKEINKLKRQILYKIGEELFPGQNYAILSHEMGQIEGFLGAAIGLRPENEKPKLDIYLKRPLSNSLQELLDIFHQHFTPKQIISHFNDLLREKKWNVEEPVSGTNIIWVLLADSAKEMLKDKGFDVDNIEIDSYIIGHQNNTATELALALFLTKMGILVECDENGHDLMNVE